MKASPLFVRLAILGLLLVVVTLALMRGDVHGVIGTTLRYDDFDFTVVGATTHASLGAVKPRGEFRVVQLAVKNSAARVDYDPTHHRAVLIDAGGAHHEVDAAGQAAWDATHPRTMPPVLHAGDAAIQDWVFDVPVASRLELTISWGNSFVDALDWLFLGDWRIALP